MGNADQTDGRSLSGFRTWSGLQKMFLLQVLTIPAVLLLFRYLQPKVLAAVLAGSLFVFVGVGTLRAEARLVLRSTYLLFSVRAFLLLGCIPVIGILFLRQLDFNQLESIRPVVHKLANVLFINLMVATFWAIRSNRKTKAD